MPLHGKSMLPLKRNTSYIERYRDDNAGATGVWSLRLLFFQYGDFGTDWHRINTGGAEYFRDQKATIQFISDLQTDHVVDVICVNQRVTARDQLEPGLFATGISPKMAFDRRAITRLLDQAKPDAIVLRTPNNFVIQWARHHRTPTLPLFADSFPSVRGPVSLIKALVFRSRIRDDIFPCVANHSLNASLSLVENFFLPQSRIIPWDRSPLSADHRVKSAPAEAGRLVAFYAGVLAEGKGVGDCLHAVRWLKDRGTRLELRLAGQTPAQSGAQDWQALAASLDIADHVVLLGKVSNTDVRDEMRAADVILVPTRHDYAEGLPNTLTEGLASRTPLVVSDHPAFASRLRSGTDVMIFPAGSVEGLANAIKRLGKDPALYARLSQNAAVAGERLLFGMEWRHLIRLFVADPHNKTDWVRDHSLEKLLHRTERAAA